ncbi:MAG TPA: ABC transporter substrate-binding protein [Burkholderiales bacterium]|nr:ABC transporter substrate-binding protein [Burkholderiales bacterium]
MKRLSVAVAACCALFAQAAVASDARPYRIALVTFLSGPASGPFGVPARNAAELLVSALNDGAVPAPYAAKGFGGRPIEIHVVDEAGGATKQVEQFRLLEQQHEFDAVVGYISSGDCLAVAPVAEELKQLTVFSDCGTPRIFEDASYRYVFRTGSHSTMDAVGAAYYVLGKYPHLASYAGINQNYAFGQDAWADFTAAMHGLRPDAAIATSQMPKPGAGQYGTEISALLASNAELVQSSFWGGDLEAFVLQAASRDLAKKSPLLLISGEHVAQHLADQIPDGTIIGGRGTHGMFAPDNALNRWFSAAYSAKHKSAPTYVSYKMAQALLGLKSAYEKAAKAGGEPDREAVIAAFENLAWETPSGTDRLMLGKGHQAVQGVAYGTVAHRDGKIVLKDVRYFAPEKVNPPEGVKSIDWISSALKPAGN